MGAASRARKPRPWPYQSASRWLIRNTDDQRNMCARTGSGDRRSTTAWMWCSWGSRASFHAVLNLALGRSGREVVGHQHRHPVSAGPGQRNTYQHVIGPTVGLVARPDHVTGGQRPVHLHVAEHVLLRKGVTGEVEP